MVTILFLGQELRFLRGSSCASVYGSLHGFLQAEGEQFKRIAKDGDITRIKLCSHPGLSCQHFDGVNTEYLYNECSNSFNVSIARLEYINEDNIAVVVQYSTFAEFNVETGVGKGNNSGYKTYWLNPPSMRVSSMPWDTSIPTSNYATLCPSMQRLPRVGTFAAEIVNSGVFLLRWAINAIMYTPGMVPIWKAGGACPSPAGSYRHSMLMSCGQELFALDDFFDSLDDASAVFWHSLSVIAQLVGQVNVANTGSNPLADILRGMDQYGYASIDMWSTQTSVIKLVNFPVTEQIDKTMAVLTNNPGSALGLLGGSFKVNVATMAWARFGYKTVSEIALTITKQVLQYNSLTEQQIWRALWTTLFDLQAAYSTTITDRNLMACGGIKLMFGLTNPWANLLYNACVMNAELYASALRLAMDIFVNIPMVKCVCKDAAGRDIRSYVEKTCAPNLPVTIRPTLYMIVNQLRGLSSTNFKQLACDAVVDNLKLTMQRELDPVFESFQSAADSISSIIDYTLTPWDKEGGHCMDFDTDPHVVVIVPQPVDYFSKCADTDLCHSLCGSYWEAFQNANRTTVDLPTVTYELESNFFPGAYDPAVVMTNATSVTEVDGTGICVDRGAGNPADFCIMVAQFASSKMTVKAYCVPQVPGGSLYPVSSTVAGYGPFEISGSLMHSAFVDDAGTVLALLLRQQDVDAVYLMTSTGIRVLPSLDPLIPKDRVLMRTVNMWAIEGDIVVDTILRSFEDTTIALRTANFQYDLNGNKSLWRNSPVNLAPYAGQYWFTRLRDGQYMLLPKVIGYPVYTLIFTKRAGALQMPSLVPVEDMSEITFKGLLEGAVLADRSLHASWVFAASNSGWNWLLQLRLDGTFTSVYSSTPVTANLQARGNCDAMSCEGCPNLVTNRLCHAYNKCALLNCVGTPVNLMRPLCGLGGILRAYATLGMQSFRGGWDIFVELLSLVITLSVKPSAGANIEFPEKDFMGYMCTAKDAFANSWSVITSALNSALNLGKAPVGFMYHGAQNVDTNADAVLTITMATVTNLLNQFSLLPLYMMLVTHQIYICQTNGVLALIDSSGFTIRIQDAKLSDANANVVGQCLTVGASTLTRYADGNRDQIGYTVGSTLQNAFNILLTRQIEPLLHMMDGGLAYFSGIINAMGKLLMAQFAAQCNPPDTYLSDVVKCACGDQELEIPADRAKETWREYALWCSGTLSMIDGSNQPFVVYNPYSYAELRAKASGMQAYVDCASQKYLCEPPGDNIFLAQGVTLLNVLVKCRENFVQKQWDPAAYVLFDETQVYRYKTTAPIKLPPDSYEVYACLISQAKNGAINAPCLDLYLSFTNPTIVFDKYWAYERALVIPPATTVPVQRVDACLTFSGPAAKKIQKFQDCASDETQENCTLSSHAWSPRSNNSVPVGQSHIVLYQGRQSDSLIWRLYEKAYNGMTAALDEAITHWSVDQANVDAQFFSAEGDLIHQTLDCIFMGPYSRVDYWPIPICEPGTECLDGPYWSRDTGGGVSRGVDPYSCVTIPSLPYTCGSPGRQSLVRYFVDTFLKQGVSNVNTSVFQKAVLAQLNQIKSIWGAPSYSTYGCKCLDGNQSQTCCSDVNGSFFPKNLIVNTESLAPENVLNAIDEYFDTVYTHALEKQDTWMKFMPVVAPGESQKYDWGDSERAVEEARLNPKQPVYGYTSDEAMTPYINVDSTLWDICHSSLKQVFWTLPIFPDNNTIHFDGLPYDGDSQKLESYIQGLVAKAALNSPLFRHYSPRHVPSDSLLCVPDKNAPTPEFTEEGQVSYDDYVHHAADRDVVVLDGDSLKTFPVYDYKKFSLGAAGCFCGWEIQEGMCVAPVEACPIIKSLTLRTDCLFWPENSSLLIDVIDLSWSCPEFELSPHWGFLDPDSNEQWLTSNSTFQASSRDLLQHGRGGLRVGNLDTLRSWAKSTMNVNARKIGVDRAQLHTCGAGARLMSLKDLAEGFVDDLFPMAQGVEEAGAVSYCLRYVIEVARLHALDMIIPESYEASSQAQVIPRWRQRCGAQLQLLSLCVNLNVFRAPNTEINFFAKKCEHFAPSYGVSFYTTPECLAFIDGVFYDPCRCMPCVGNTSTFLDTKYLKNNEACRLRFDPRKIVRKAPVGWWATDEDGGVEANEYMADFSSLLVDNFAYQMMNNGDATGNTIPGGPPWWSAEGPMEHCSQDCDMISDWWPDDWDYPIGYHVTVPCEAEDTAYRSFHQAFAYTGLGADGIPELTYEQDTLRDGGLIDQYFGVGGLCRSMNWGVEMFSTNTMRYCTSVLSNEHEDYTIYWQEGEKIANSSTWTPWSCTTDAQFLPWPDFSMSSSPNTDTHESTLYSVGTLPNMPIDGDVVYPSDLDSKVYDVGPWQDILKDNGWGRLCGDYRLAKCTTNSDCPLKYQCRGLFCRNSYISCQTNQDCVSIGLESCEGVCIEKQIECISHSECKEGRMCTGLGKCVTPVLTVQNKVTNDDFAFQVNAKNNACPDTSRNFSMLGASYWAYVTNDVLRVHGMCSYGDWYKYQLTLENCAVPSKNNEYWEVDPTQCRMINLDAQALNVTYWWEKSAVRPQVMFMHPSNCDRDYERLKDFTQCAPKSARIHASSSKSDIKLNFDSYAKMHIGDTPSSNEGVRIPIAKMPGASDSKYGFLGVQGVQNDDVLNNLFESCSNIDQCTAPPFTVRGAPASRKMLRLGTWVPTNYSLDNIFQCGVMGYIEDNRCKLDLSVLQFYRFMCVETEKNTKCKAIAENLQTLCDAVSQEYAAGYAGVLQNVEALAELFYTIPQPQDLDGYLDTTQCMEELFVFMNDARQLYSQFYWVLDFVLYEFPFDWFYQCVVMSGSNIDPTSRYNQDCIAFKNKERYSIAGYTPSSSTGDSPLTMLKFVRGGYTRNAVTGYLERHYEIAKKRLNATILGLVNSIYNGVDTSYPRCSTVQRWKIGPDFGIPYIQLFRAIIDTWYVRNSCQGSWLDDQIRYLQSGGWQVNSDNWVEQLTTFDPAYFVRDLQWKSSKTLLGLITDFILASINVRLVDRVMGDNPTPAGLTWVSRREAIALDNKIPPVFAGELPDSLDPSFMNYDFGREVLYEDPFIPHVCVYEKFTDDPNLRLIFQTKDCFYKNVTRPESSVQDFLMVCKGDVKCTDVPIFYSINGMYHCQYYPERPGTPCDSTLEGCGKRLLDALYEEVASNYQVERDEPFLSLSVLPWFETNNAWNQNFKFELIQVLDYLGNIMPDKEKTIMCTINTQQPVNLMNCTNPNYEKLRDHVKKYYKYDGSVIVPRESQLEWPVDQRLMTSGGVFAYASTSRDMTKTFLNALFDDQNVCKGDTSGDNRVCWRASNSTTWNSVNPWLLGYWNPYTGCDVEYTGQTQTSVETVNAKCSEIICPPDSPYFKNMPFGSRCRQMSGQRVLTPNVPQIDIFGDDLSYNLCHHRLSEDQIGCLHDQGLLGGFDGLPVASGDGSVPMNADTKYENARYTVSPDMYTPSFWEIPEDFYGGLFDATNPLWEGKDSVYGFLRVPPSEIGIHRIGLRITRENNNSFARLDVYKLPLSDDSSEMDLDAPNMPSRPVREWIPTLINEIQIDSITNLERDRFYRMGVGNTSSPSCPLQRYAFYSSSKTQFTPSMPSPQRANHLFGNLTRNAFAHPMMDQLTTGAYLGQYVTVNGYCFCPKVEGIPQVLCQIPIGANTDQCSLTQTVAVLMGDYEVESHVFKPHSTSIQEAPCEMHLDWPNLPIPLRDGSPGKPASEAFLKASDQINQKCHVLDRLNPFKFKYKSVPEFPSRGVNSFLDGVCQTRRVTHLTSSVKDALKGARCVRDTLEPDRTRIRCAGRQGTTIAQRMTQLFPPDSVNKSRTFHKSRCQKCSPPPKFKTTKGAPMPPESSFGRPFRLSAERVMAKDIRDAVCAGSKECGFLNRSAWRAGEFMRNFLLNPSALFLNASTPVNSRYTPQVPDDSKKWTDHGWVYCPDRASLVSGKGCKGAITRDMWLKSKTTVCPQMVRSLSSNGSQGGMSKTPFFNIDRYTQAVNLAYGQAIQLISTANCIAAGNVTCLPRPWVYHQASYVPSNQEWVYRTVLEYYRLVDPNACPLTQAEQNMIQLNQLFMKNCPANIMRFFDDILSIVRLVSTDLAYIVSTMLAMTVKLITLLFAGLDAGLKTSIRVARQQIAEDWQWIKNRAREMLSGINRLLLDMIFTTGQVGSLLLDFLTRVCSFINESYAKLLGGWCNFVQKYMAGFLTYLRKGLSMIASGFEILQDFMDVMLQGVLPAAFMGKYGNKMFQNTLIEKYSQPNTRHNRFITKIQSSARINIHSADRYARYINKQISSLAGNKGRASLLVAGLTAGFTAYETIMDIQGAMMYPSNFTLFDFSSVFNGIDKLMTFLINDQTCVEYDMMVEYGMSVRLFQCFNRTLLDDPVLSNRAATSIAPTLCWANAQTSLGQSNLFSCHSGSTCCPDDACEVPIVCDECPVTKFGEERYACNTLTQQCQCAIVVSLQTPCMNNMQCEGDSQCILSSLASSVSYGTIPCRLCTTKNVYCSVKPSGMPGQCTCYMDSTMPKALCTDTSGTVTRVSGTTLCGYSPDSTVADSVWQFSLGQLAMVPCLQATTAICSTVWLQPSTSIRMAVAIPPLRTSKSRRRLLWDDTQDAEDPYEYDGDFEPFGASQAREILAAPGWNATAAPCAELVRKHNAGVMLGVLDRHELHRCAYWRFAGRRVIQTLNLTALAPYETFLISAEDLASALSHPDALLELITTPWVLPYSMLYHPWLRPLRAVATVLMNSLEQIDWIHEWLDSFRGVDQKDLINFLTDVETFESESLIDREEFLNWTQWHLKLRENRLVNPRKPSTVSIKNITSEFTGAGSGKGRHLLSVLTDIQLVQAMSAKVSTGGDSNPPVPERVAQAWGAGPFVWPPRYEYGFGACPIGVSVLDISTQSMTVLVLYYANFDRVVPPVDRSFRAALPQISLISNGTRLSLPTPPGRGGTWASAVYHYVTGKILGVRPDDIVEFLTGSGVWSLEWLLVSLTQCDLGAAVSCSRHKRDLLMSIVVFVLLYTLIQWVSSITGLPVLASAFFYGAPLLLLWYVYGVAPSCFPILPTCLVSDLVAAVEYVTPETITLPPELLCNGESSGRNATCLRSCSDLNFTSWLDTLAFAVCDTDAGWCASLATVGVNGSFSQLLAPFQDALLKKHALITDPDTKSSLIAACRICTWVTWVSVLPFICLAIACVFALGSILTSIVQIGPSFFALLAQTWAFHRTPGEQARLARVFIE